MLKKITYLIPVLVGIVYPFHIHSTQFFGRTISPINVQHTIDPLNMNPITIDQENLSQLVEKANIALVGTICTAAGAYLFTKGIKHALCSKDHKIEKSVLKSSWLKSRYTQGMITSCIGIAAFLGGLYIIGHNETVLNAIK